MLYRWLAGAALVLMTLTPRLNPPAGLAVAAVIPPPKGGLTQRAGGQAVAWRSLARGAPRLSSSAPARSARTLWSPPPGTTWYWQLSGVVNLTYQVAVYDIDGFDNPASAVATLHARGTRAICYMDAGTWENWRPDAGLFPASVKGNSNGWPGEKWLDIRQLSILGPILQARAQLCVTKGFDAIEWDNVDGYSNATGFPISAADQLTFNRFLAATAHALGLAVALKNDPDQVSALLPSFDFELDEQCFQYTECAKLTPFIAAGKAVFEVEYNLPTRRFCAQARRLRFSAARAALKLDGSLWSPC